MAPPPNSGDANNMNDDPLGGIDPMKWLESLAARQGANPDELTTSADIDVPVPPADTVIDEPGYTPGYDTGKPKQAEPVQPAAAQPAPTPAPTPAPAAPEPAPAMSSDDLMNIDPMKWLESLAARQGANPDELTTEANIEIPVLPADTVVDEPGYTPGYDTGKPKQAEPVQPAAAQPAPTPAPTPAPAAPEPAPAMSSDDLMNIDPMKWLESLAARQGANPDELTTEANIDVPVPENAVIDEPGYTPGYETFGSKPAAPAAAQPAPTPQPEPEPEPVASTPLEDPLGGLDPLTWLESLASEQSPELADLLGELPVSDTMADVSVAQVSDVTAADEMTPDEAAALLGLDQVGAAENALGEADPMAWLESLSNQAASSTSDADFLEDLALAQTGPLPSFTPREPIAESAFGEAPSEDFLETGGMSNDPNEVERWLFAQANKLEETRQELEGTEAFDPDAPAEPASDLPDWLKDVGHAAPAATISSAPVMRDEIAMPTDPSELPDWLRAPDAQPMDDLQTELLNELKGTGPLTPPAEPATTVQIPKLTSQELTALTQPSSPDEVDEWAQALDEEYERKVAGDESVPDWYMEAISRAEAEPPAAALTTRPQAELAPAQPAAGADTGLPDWLNVVPDTQEQAALPADIPDWLRDMSVAAPQAPQATPQPAAETEDWLEGIAAAPAEELPDWLTEAAPAQPAQPVQPTPAPTPEPPLSARPAPEPTRPASQPAPAAAQPSPSFAAQATPEAQARLQHARETAASNLSAGLEHYQSLVDSSQLLEETRGDLRRLIEQNPKEPKLRRLLGDTYMRLGDLQAALDTYRSALDQL